MGTSSWLATTLDVEMLSKHNAAIWPPNTSDAQMPDRPGPAVAGELSDRFLVRYVRTTQLGMFARGSAGRQHWVTPTAYEPDETVSWLALSPTLPVPSHALILDAQQIAWIKGPRYVRLGSGVEYLLPYGFPGNAVVGPPWEVVVR
jgi:hypothetical protein